MRTILTIFTLAALLGGCDLYHHYEQPPMGIAHYSQIELQTYNPQAGGTKPVTGIYGPAGKHLMDSYLGGWAPKKSGGGSTNFLELMMGGKVPQQ